MYLAEIRGIASKFAETISKILDIDVMIIDNNYHRIANTFRYVDEPTPITRYSMLGEVLHTGKVVAVRDKSTYEHCKNCQDLSQCAISGLISVPIFFESKVVGAIALLVPVNKTSPIFDNQEVSIQFLEGMSDLLSSKLKNIDDYNKLNLIKKERETIIDTIEDGLVFINDTGEIVHCNNQFENFFKIEREVLGEHIEKLLDHPLIHEMMMFRENFSYRVFYYEQRNHSFYGLISCRNIMINGRDYGALLTFKSLGRVYNALNEISDNKANITFASIMGNDPSLTLQINRAKQLAVTDENILICGEPGLGKSIFARAIHNFSDRAKQYFVTVDCDNIPFDLLENELFGSESETSKTNPGIGKLRMAHKGTIFFKNISEMPMYLQKRLVEVMRTRELKQGSYKGFNIDVRMIFDCSQDLSLLVKQRMFNEELYFRIAKNTLTIPPLVKRKGDIKIIVNSLIDKLRIKHMKPRLTFEPEVLKMMYDYSWPGNVREIEKVVELIICSANDELVKADEVMNFSFACQNEKNTKTVDEMERELMRKLLSEYSNKDQIAKIMGIGRATLYRKMRKFGLSADAASNN
ncbi:MAG: sigma 54-interacting transcriptional regulator [Clostridia bacterium]|nr:sigma 54-interacting transcriptional regulator [Clostridia bacterium]